MTLLDPANFCILLLALVLEAAFGYPEAVYRAIRHPVVWIGAVIAALDRRLNLADLDDSTRRTLGAASLAAVLLLSGGVAAALVSVARSAPFGWLAEGILAASLLAQRSLFAHVAAVASALEIGGLAAGRKAVAEIVGRNPETLDKAGIARAAIESLAENFSDGVTAPAFWLALLGLPGIVLYKAINTADSMIGHLTPRHRAFGWAAARLDDLVNLPASRLSALLIVLAAFVTPNGDPNAAWRAVLRDAKRHRSPNAGWPEAAMAGALGLKLAGPRTYGTTRVADTWMGDGRVTATSSDIRAALALYRRVCGVLWLGVAAMALAMSL
jgi:adenosylcobinamide-phosphate synthase